MNKTLTIEIHGTTTGNRGAELMTCAIADRMRKTFPGVRLVVQPYFGDFEARCRYGLLATWEFYGRIRAKLTSAGVRYGSPGLRQAGGFIDPTEIDLILDASGFSFSDQWGPSNARALVKRIKSRSPRNIPLIMLPQAFGPFANPEVAKWSRELFDLASLVCAREAHSLAALKALGAPASKLRQFPDFTLIVDPIAPRDIDLPEKYSAVVPNIRMLDKGSLGQKYLDFLVRSIESLTTKQMKPVFVLHDAQEDRTVIKRLAGSIPAIPVIEHNDPRVLKFILGNATCVVGSRFHALVSALSQGVPCIGAGWSHKYPELFADFDCRDMLLENLGDFQKMETMVTALADPARLSAYKSRILNASSRLKTANESMWSEVEFLIKQING